MKKHAREKNFAAAGYLSGLKGFPRKNLYKMDTYYNKWIQETELIVVGNGAKFFLLDLSVFKNSNGFW